VRREILCVVEERVVGNDNMVAWDGRCLQLPESLRPALREGKGARASNTGRVWLLRERSAMRRTSGGSTYMDAIENDLCEIRTTFPSSATRETIRRWMP
jgi:hypothetical protein